jgi:hypothetical protein
VDRSHAAPAAEYNVRVAAQRDPCRRVRRSTQTSLLARSRYVVRQQANADRTLGYRVRDVVLTVGQFEPVMPVDGTIRTLRVTAYEVEAH